MLNTLDSYCGHCIRYRVYSYSYCIRYTITLKVDTTWQYTITINVEHLIFFGGHCIRYRVYIYSYCIRYTMTMKVDTTWRYTMTIKCVAMCSSVLQRVSEHNDYNYQVALH